MSLRGLFSPMRAMHHSTPILRARNPLIASSPSSSPILRSLPNRTFTRIAPLRRKPPRDPHEELRNAKPLFQAAGSFGDALRSQRTHIVVIVAAGGAIVFYFANQETVPVSGRRRFNCFRPEWVESFSEAEVKQVIREIQTKGGFLGEWDPRTRMVQRVIQRLIPVSGMADAQWEVRVIDDDSQANAFVMPGNKVFVFSGILPIARNDDGLAAVLGHEIAHNLAQHTSERLSGQIGINVLLVSLGLLEAGFMGSLFLTQYLGAAFLGYLFSLPMSRQQESEADQIGLMIMAEACYDPKEAISFWDRMDRQDKMKPPEWMSTHPSNRNRIEDIQRWLPKAMDKKYNSDCHSISGFSGSFRRAMDRGSIMGSSPSW